MLTILSIIGSLFLIYLIRKLSIVIEFRNQVKTLFKESTDITKKIFQLSQLDNLPEPVQRYFNYALKEGQLYISY